MGTYYLQAAEVLPPNLHHAAAKCASHMQAQTEEFRLRIGQPLTLVKGDGEALLDSPLIWEEDLRNVLELASNSSVHTVLDQICSGFIVIHGGHRIGLCGEIAMKNGQVHAYRRLSSMAIRIARPLHGVGAEVLSQINVQGRLCSTLILAPPGAGKTTLLREIVRRVSDGIGVCSRRVGLADERREVSALRDGLCQLDVGKKTDVIADCPKAVALEILLRGMNPQVLAVDEITAERDIEAMAWAAGCGVTLLATAHGSQLNDLSQRPLYQRMMELRLFERIVVLENNNGVRTAKAEVIS